MEYISGWMCTHIAAGCKDERLQAEKKLQAREEERVALVQVFLS